MRERAPNLVDFDDEDANGSDDEDGNNGNNDDGRNNGNNDDDEMSAWVGVSRKSFNEIKKKNYSDNKLHSKLLGSKILYLTNTNKLINRMDKLDSNKKYLDKETFSLYNKVKKESIDLVNTIEKAEETDSRIALKNVFELIREIFSKKSSSSESE